MGDSNHIEKRILDAISIITIGVVLLLNTTGVLSWSIWINLFKLWPLLLISAGVGLVFSWSRASRFVGGVISLMIFLGAMAIAIGAQTLNFNFNIFNLVSSSNSIAENQVIIKEEDFDAPVETMNLNVDISAGEFEIKSSVVDELLVLESDYSKNFSEPALNSQLTEGVLNVDFTENRRGFQFGNARSSHKFVLGETLATTALNLKLGAGSGKVNLTDRLIDSIKAEVGAGSMEISLDEYSTPFEGIDLKVGLGSINLNLPKEAGYKVSYKIGLGSLKVNGSDVAGVGKNDVYTSENYENAVDQINITVDVGLGSLEIITEN